jgi:hypothetical protein
MWFYDAEFDHFGAPIDDENSAFAAHNFSAGANFKKANLHLPSSRGDFRLETRDGPIHR